MNPWPFVISSYALTALATIATSLWAWQAARKAESRAEQLGGRD
jgi:hypothetical protein